MDKILSFTKPIITSYPLHAQLLSGIQNSHGSKPWILSNYIQLFASDNFIKDNNYISAWFDFFTTNFLHHEVPVISKQKIKRNLIDMLSNDITEFVINMLNDDYYVWLFIDKYYIPGTQHYYKNTFPHSILVYGYEEERNVFYCAGFFDNTGYKQLTVKREDIKKAYYSKELFEIRNRAEYLDYVIMYKSSNKNEYKLDINNIISLLNDYYYSVNSSEHLSMIRNPIKGKYGLDVYTTLKEYVIFRNNDQLDFDVRAFHILYDHKKCMNFRIDYLYSLGFLKFKEIKLFLDIERKSLILRNTVIKCNIKYNPDTIKNILSMIDDIAYQERIALDVLLSELIK
ncbi:hypothetical protein [Paenibacillus sp. IITD108]|uniref:hypothetical protein n=1 Tax=Paenibacillus sp. IITD108 TaxID=3116649 RepID=UPI002F3F8105